MRLLLLLLALLPLATAECPEFLQGIEEADSNITKLFEEAIDVACGRRNYSSVFWSRLFYDRLTLNMANKSDTETYEVFGPLFENLQEKFDAMDSDEATDAMVDAKDFIDSTFERNKVLDQQRSAATDSDANPMSFVASIFQIMVLPLTQIFTPDVSIALMQTMKAGFGVPETAVEQKQAFIDTAMNAIERAGLDDPKMGQLFARLYVLATESFVLRRTSFDQFAEWTEKEWNSTDVGPLEIVPAIEVLYLEYQHLKGNESRSLVDWYLASNADADDVIIKTIAKNSTEEDNRTMMSLYAPSFAAVDPQEKVMEKLKAARKLRAGEFAAICPSNSIAQCFAALPIEARKELVATFPELFAYLNRMYGYEAPIGPKTDQIERNEIDGSGEGSGEGSGQL